MGYRDERTALKQRIEQLEQQAARSVSRTEAAELRAALEEARARLDDEREAVGELLDRLDTKLGRKSRRRRWRWALAATFVVAALGALGVLLYPSHHWERGAYVQGSFEGAPNAVRHLPSRREVDVELARLMPELDGCLPEGANAEVMIEALFEGHNGALREVTVRNVSQHDSYPSATVGCLEQTMERVGVPPFRAGSFLYHLTLRWTDGRLQTPAIWERYGLAPPPRE